MSVDVWTDRMSMRPELRKDILDRIKKITPISNVAGVWLLGSITGYQYNETSDIDVNILVYNYNDTLKILGRKESGITTNSGRHPVNLFIRELGDTVPTWQDSYYGVYNILKDDWETLPPNKELYRDPEVEYNLELLSAKRLADTFNREIIKLRKLLLIISKLKKEKSPLLDNYRILLNEQVSNLISMTHSFEDDRKFAYQWGWGVPRKDFRNIVYKLIEHGPYGNLFLLLEKVPMENEFGSEDMLRTEIN